MFLGDRGFYWHWFILEQTVPMLTFRAGYLWLQLTFLFNLSSDGSKAQLITQ